MGSVSVTRVHRIDKPLANEENTNIKSPNPDDDIELRNVSTEKIPSVSVIKLPRRKSIGSHSNIIEVPKSVVSFRQNAQITDELPQQPQSAGSVIVSKVKRSSFPNGNNIPSYAVNDGLSSAKDRQTTVVSMIRLPHSNLPSYTPNESVGSSKSINVQQNFLHIGNQEQQVKVHILSNLAKILPVNVNRLPRAKSFTNTLTSIHES
ncbi:unnamed protein product [Rotaria sp. Silwood2]|nr:unnamed protein product [Rotaria sp. Silwood2]CAF4050815.1 unnamed protein product [Rotaria sp. Silwood2]